MRICSDQPCIVLLTEKDVWIRVNGKEPISLKANHMALLNCENNIIDVSSLNNTLVAHISHDIIKDYLRLHYYSLCYPVFSTVKNSFH
ncbi:HTH-type transcriptional regulator AdiY [Klebsiella pneumoniae]|nr:HTH-type transcriptional regulator AdiY [Klebsiella pneumoniae]